MQIYYCVMVGNSADKGLDKGHRIDNSVDKEFCLQKKVSEVVHCMYAQPAQEVRSEF